MLAIDRLYLARQHVLAAEEFRDVAVLGAVITSRAGPAWRILPFSITTTRSASAIASSWVWVTCTKVMPSSRCIWRSCWRIWMRRNSSSAESGSSNKEDARLGDGGAGERDALLLAAGELRRETVGEFGEPDFLHHGVGGLAALGLGDAAHLQRKGDIVAHVQMGEQRVGLEHHGGTARHRWQADDVVAADKKISPAVGSSCPAIIRRIVVLPQPDGPSRQQ